MADGCRVGCASSRREFLRAQIPGAVLAAMVGVSVADAAEGYPLRDIEGRDVAPQQKSYPIPAADGVSIDKKTQVILVRLQGKVIAFNLACPHENTALRWKDGAGRFECPKHNSKYAADGKFLGGRATRNMDRLAITRSGNDVIVDLSKLVKSDAQPADWAAAVISV
jgi:Rieske Fe-S protein